MPSTAAEEKPIDLRLLNVAMRRDRRLVALMTGAGVLLGALGAWLLPNPYWSTSLVLVESPSGSAAQLTGLNFEIDTHARIAQSEVVLRRAISDIGGDLSPQELQAQMEVATPTSSLLQIRVADRSPTQARALATAVAKSHLAYVGELSGTSDPGDTASAPGRLLQDGLEAVRQSPVARGLIGGLLGGLVGVLVGTLLALAKARRTPGSQQGRT